MTVYISHNAIVGQPRRPEPGSTSSHWQTRQADPPLLTHAWRRLFEQQARESDRP
ncbi:MULTISPECIES: multiple cyclophane-containing RiPP AmcA [Micromonospora]|uniref:multiple cyclophane-containing RiPP AmcA n=1 Tax=Micromonospora TaxID=1873 RepID=UPI0027DB5F62|nr:multiple cyclophane-containing RiPP AmcA [Micromonospora sediminimaris]